MCPSWRQTIASVRADPPKANQNGAAGPKRSASSPPTSCPMMQAEGEPQPVDRAHPALEVVRGRALPHRVGERPPHERVGAEHEHHGVGDERHRGQGEREVHEHLQGQADLHQQPERHPALEPVVPDHGQDAADGRRGRQQAEADLVDPEPLLRPVDEHPPRGTPRDVEGEDHEDERPHRARGAGSSAARRGCRAPRAAARGPARGPRPAGRPWRTARPRAAPRSPARRRAGRAPRRTGTPRRPARPSGWRRGTPTSGARSRPRGRRARRSRAGRHAIRCRRRSPRSRRRAARAGGARSRPSR